MREIRHLDMLARTVPLAGKRVLDIGSGKGGLVMGLAAAGAEPVGIERQETLARAARQSCPAGCLGFTVGDGSALPFADGRFDLALFFFSLHHIPQADMVQALAEAGRVTRADGRVYVAEPLAEGKYFELIRQVHDETLARAHAVAAMAEAGQAGLRAIEQFTYLYPLAFASAEVFLEWLVAADPNRGRIVADLRLALVERFHRDADRQGMKFTFRQAVRVNLFAVAPE